MAEAGTKTRRRAWLWAIALCVVMVVYTIVGFWVAPRIIRDQLLKQVPPATHRQVQVGEIEVNPYRLTLTISNLTLTEPDGEVFASWRRFHANLESDSLWRRALVLSRVEIVAPLITIQRNADGALNFANLFPTNSTPSSTPPPEVEVQDFQLTEGQVALRDRAVPGGFEKRFQDLQVAFTNLNTRASDRAPGYFSARGVDAERLMWKGDVGLNPIASAGRFEAQSILVPRNGPYVRQATTAVVTDGHVDTQIDYLFREAGTNWDVVLSNAAVVVHQLTFKLPNSPKPMLMMTEIGVSNVTANLLRQELRVGNISFRDGKFGAQRSSGGSVDVAQSMRPDFVEHAIADLTKDFAGWRIEAPRILGERLDIAWADEDLDAEVKLALQLERLEVKGLSNQTNQPIQVLATTRWGTNGLANLKLEGTLIPTAASAEIDFQHIRLPMIQPYVAKVVNLVIQQGEVGGQWKVGYNQKPGGPLLSVEGGLEISRFLAFDTQAGRDFVKWDAFEVKGTEASFEPARVRIQEIRLQSPGTSFVLMTNGQFNALSLIKAPGDAAPSASTNPSPAQPSAPLSVELTVDRLSLTNASLYAADRMVPGEFSTSLERVSGVVTDLAWPTYKKSRVDLTGYVGPRAPFLVEGWILPDPKQMFIDLHVATTNAELIPFTPYTLKFAGYPLKEGRVTADVRYQVNGRQVVGSNIVVVDRLTLGPKASGTPILSLPIKLGISLLKDSDGRITLDIPVKGSLDDPEFGISKVVWQTIKGIFVKVATAPFKLIGSLFGGSEDEGQELQLVRFDAGATNLATTATNQLTKLVHALQKRPELALAVRGGASPTEDGPVLAHHKLSTALQALQPTTGTVAQAQAVHPTGTSLATAANAPLLAQLFAQSFPATNSTPVAPATDAAPSILATPTTPPPPPTPAEMEQQLLEKFKPTESDFTALREARVSAVSTWLLAESRLTPERLILPSRTDTNSPPLVQPAVEFTLE